jgi:hypothetical protein
MRVLMQGLGYRYGGKGYGPGASSGRWQWCRGRKLPLRLSPQEGMMKRMTKMKKKGN